MFIPVKTIAHPGRTASDGCHYCRTNCSSWGVQWDARHCHSSKGIPQPSEPIRSHYDEGDGYTTPAPNYKTPKIKIDNATEKIEIKEKKESWLIRLFRFFFG